MGEAISDAQVVRVLRPFVRATAPLLDALRESDPLGLRTRAEREAADLVEVQRGPRERLLDRLTALRVPGTAAWAGMDAAQRSHWWVSRVGRFTALLTAVPGLGGALADRLPVQDALGAAAQGLLLCAIAGEHGMTEVGDRVRLLAWVLFEREVDPELAAGRGVRHDAAAEDVRTTELTEEVTESSRRHGRITLRAAARTLWRLGRLLLSITDELEKRPQGRFYHQAFGMLPVVGMLADYFGERSALKRVAKRARRWLREHR
ncbi:hypothetical protein [Amycolatopsis cihanbeyliensis]|uniref:Uncharacterized protein n=1 Tax=Amycolatopsis cihanbeyliensis TaxID=1128664 RepID=A0A542DHK6_AMYCI|nr:hypothetical protein [Amycolatopsis cihanbeyliensis]TQJ02569.1 hypothetical protein FB471_2301 [Amycolatopsis cihanbeyliensis]